jgi:hypothetical protein
LKLKVFQFVRIAKNLLKEQLVCHHQLVCISPLYMMKMGIIRTLTEIKHLHHILAWNVKRTIPFQVIIRMVIAMYKMAANEQGLAMVWNLEASARKQIIN